MNFGSRFANYRYQHFGQTLVSGVHHLTCPGPQIRALHTLGKVAKRYGARYYQHSCGSVRALIPDFLEIGVDVLDPIHVLAEGMEPAGLKRDFGKVLCFSGGVDEQELLNNGTPDQVRSEVRKLLATIGVDGGYFLGPTHNFQVDIPVENILAMYDEAGKC